MTLTDQVVAKLAFPSESEERLQRETSVYTNVMHERR